ncbi:hypothetical protein Hanom_Chr08g00742031 [Helianthus anomalus]
MFYINSSVMNPKQFASHKSELTPSSLRYLHCVPEFTNGRKGKETKKSKNILCSRVSFKEGKEMK